ncbi:MAG TPA: phospholipase D-like domain-containing protein [Candidatus Dormibacteraeota bacterium]
MPELICALGPDNAGTVITGLVRGARTSLDVAMYEIGPSYAWAIAAAARRGVRVRVILDRHSADGNAGTAAAIAGAGGACRVLTRGSGTGHWKLVLIDGVRVATGTGNLVWRDAPRDSRGRLPPVAPPLRGTREWWAITDDAEVAGGAALAVETAWAASRLPPRAWRGQRRVVEPGAVGTPAPQVEPLRLTPAPGSLRLAVGGLAVGSALADAVEQAHSRVLLIAPYLHPRAAGVRSLMAAAWAARTRGADVRVLLGARPPAADAAHLCRTGMPARWMDPAVSTRGHAKGVIADGVAIVMSANLSRPGLGANWESALVIRSEAAADYLAAAWQRDWSAAQPVSGAV